jgi:hypothetical protein
VNPRIYRFSSVDPKTGKPTTSKERQYAYRRAKKLGMTMPEYRAFMEKMVDRMYAFYDYKDYGRAAKAFKQAMQEFHPDKGGDPEDAKRIIAAWDAHKKLHGWSGPAPSVTPKVTPDPAALAADARIDAEILAERAANPNYDSERITKAIAIFEGKLPRPKRTPTVTEAV